jgi:chaperone required for assembly of F1-ATPase
MKRFYKSAAATVTEDGFGVALDGRPLKSPAKLPFVLPTQVLAEAIAGEWAAQGDAVRPAEMPLMQLAATTIDRLGPNRALAIDTVAGYAATDLVCYRADRPAALAARQQAVWQPLLDWAMTTYDAPLVVTHGVAPQKQPAEALAALRAAVAAQDDWHLTALHTATTLLGSLVLGLALLAGRIDAEAAVAAAELDTEFQIERWGEDAEAAQRRVALRAEIAAVERFVRLLA